MEKECQKRRRDLVDE
jgi:hypothetical protein